MINNTAFEIKMSTTEFSHAEDQSWFMVPSDLTENSEPNADNKNENQPLELICYPNYLDHVTDDIDYVESNEFDHIVPQV